MTTLFGSSQIIELIAEDGVQFFIHKDTLSSQSLPFREALSGVWTEATERKIHLNDWDSPTVSRLVEYLYTGDYSYTDPCPLHPAPGTPGEPESEVVVEPTPAEVPDGIRPLTPLNSCMEGLIKPKRTYVPCCEDRLLDFAPADHDFKNALLTHAHVYALAQYKDIESLRTTALDRIYSTLKHLNPLPINSHSALSVVELASYTYANTDHLSQSEEPLRRLVSHFAALNFAALLTETEAGGLLVKGGEFVKDVMEKVRRRLPDTQDAVWGLPYTGKGYVSGLRYIDDPSNRIPQDYIQELCQNNAYIDYPYKYYTWLVAEYTPTAADACTSINITTKAPVSSTYITMTRAKATTSYIELVKDQEVAEKITHVALARSEGFLLDLRPVRGYTGMSANMNPEWLEYPLYLVWRAAKPPV